MRRKKIKHILNINAKEFVPNEKFDNENRLNVNAKEFVPIESLDNEDLYLNTLTGQLVYMNSTAKNLPNYLTVL
jgi:hypothetical protein